MKPSDSKGFWGTVTVTDTAVTGEEPSLRVTGSVTHDNSPLLDAYKSVVAYSRALWLQVPTATGNPSKGPRFYAVTLCEHEDEYGVTSSKVTAGRRWACNTCFSFAPCVWADGPTPDREEQEQEWADWAAKQKTNSTYTKTRKRLRIRT